MTRDDLIASARRPAARAVTMASLLADTRDVMAQLAALPGFADPDIRLRSALAHVRKQAGVELFDRALVGDPRFPDGEALVEWVRARV